MIDGLVAPLATWGAAGFGRIGGERKESQMALEIERKFLVKGDGWRGIALIRGFRRSATEQC